MKETHLKGRLQAIALTACAAAMIWACRETAAEAKTAAGLCLTVMIPSLYAFTVLSKLMISHISSSADPFHGYHDIYCECPLSFSRSSS